ncbi:MAG: pheromone processing endoprotease [Piccolia ochrophora]|nr:MAG: pheromone processing endoprotease [Piccolia ochrophora]
MRLSAVLPVALLLGMSVALGTLDQDFYSHDFYALHLHPSLSPSQLADSLGLAHEGQLGELRDHHIFSGPKHRLDIIDDALRKFRKRKRTRDSSLANEPLTGILFAQKQRLKPRLHKRSLPFQGVSHVARDIPVEPPALDGSIAKKQQIASSLGIQDPIFMDQWHLFNTREIGHDLNVTGVWLQGITGHNATVALVDDGLDMDSEDLKVNYLAEGSYDFNDKSLEPRPRLSDDKHGTRCAGEVAAAKNNVCGVGVAWDAKVAGIRILSKQISDADEAVALNYAFQKNHIYSCSWGPPDDGQAMDAPGILIKRAMINGVQNGRDGKGSIFVFASGNGASKEDNCNFDGYTNSIYSITIGAVDRKGLHPYYSEHCCAQLAVTYSSGSGDAIHTTDVGVDKCYSRHGGTSAAAPLGAGILALVLSVRPDLTWRDLQYLTMQTAVPMETVGGDWQETAIGKKFSHTFGYGKYDAYAIVEAAKTFKSVKPQAWYNSPWLHVKHEIPQGDHGVASTVEVTKEELDKANFERVEHVTVTMNLEHQRRGDVSVQLHSPHGVVSHLSRPRIHDEATSGYQDWTFMSVVHWGESGVGTWTVIVKDGKVNEYSGTLTDWKLTLWGECIDVEKAVPFPMPTEHDDDDHDATTTVSATTVLVSDIGLPTHAHPANPTDHPDRPVNEKPGENKGSATATASQPPATGEPAPSSSPTSDNFLPSFFPTFGVSKKSQIWIYGSVASILLFCGGLGIYLYTARRKRLRNEIHDNYEFEKLEDQEGGQALTGGAGGKRARRRAGDLYDAFAGESDEELFSDDEDDYQDVIGESQGPGVSREEEDDNDADTGPSDPREDRKALLQR